MSISVTSGVWQCGPPEMVSKFLLLAIADNADDFGFAFPSHETLAQKSCCDKRTVIRRLERLEECGWIRVLRKAVNGKGNLYWVNVEKIGVSVSPVAKVSQVIMGFIRRSGASESPIFWPGKSGDTKRVSGDNPQPRHVTPVQSQVTKTPLSGDRACHPNRNNHHEPSREPSSLEPPPTPEGVERATEDGTRFSAVKTALKQKFQATPLGLQQHRFRPLRTNGDDFDDCFRNAILAHRSRQMNTEVFCLEAENPQLTRAGCEKYAGTLERLVCQFFHFPQGTKIRFVVREQNTNTTRPREAAKERDEVLQRAGIDQLGLGRHSDGVTAGSGRGA